MKKRKVLAVLSLTVVLAGMNTIGAMAALPQTAGSEAEIRFDADTRAKDILDPEDHDIIIAPSSQEGKITGQQGTQTIDFVPNFRFDPGTTANNDQTSGGIILNKVAVMENGSKVDELEDVPLFVQVTDSSGDGGGWTLSVQQTSAFTNSENSLTGTVITLKNVGVKSKTIDRDSSQMIDVKTGDIELKYTGSGDKKEIATAAAGKGYGTYSLRFGNIKLGTKNAEESVELFIPEGNSISTKDAYKADITWTLENVFTP